jgi:hypothetical protein
MTFLTRTYATWIAVAVAAMSPSLLGCNGDTTSSSATDPPPVEDPPSTDFISDNPQGSSGRNDDAGGSSSSGGGSQSPSAAPGDGDAERAIAEADIIQVRDGRLYALSQYSGLSVIDISRRDRLSLLGRYQAGGMPFEMYLRDGVVYAMFSSWGQYVQDDASGTYSWVQTSRIEALDVSDPAHIGSLGSFDLPGAISDSRIVGDVLYAVTFEDGYCYGCGATPNTTVTSLSIGDPAAIGVADQLTYGDNDPYGYGWRRSISVTADRMYVAGIEWDGTSEGHSTIQVIDISDPGGDLVEGASVEASGQIQSRWQMDEHEGVLRVISQPGVWRTSALPAVQTFSIVSSQELLPLGYTELALPRPESLRSVRFDGPHAYAITAEQTDPLFTIDLSDPAHPAQRGELEMPGWVYHMEPRGDRLLALGFDNAASEGSLHVSLFDVSDLAHPALLQRVPFGGDWSSVGEDQDRIHKAFTILDELGTILVPYSGWSYSNGEYGCGSYTSGIQLIDFTRDTLTKRGAALARGQARRAFVHDERLFSVSDESVRTFNIGDRDAPATVTDLSLATVVNQTVVSGDLAVRLSADWWTTETRLEVAPASDAGRAEPLGTLDLGAVLPADSSDGCYDWALSGARLFANGQHVYVVWPASDATTAHVAVVDVTDATAPRVASTLDVPFNWYGMYWYYGAVVSPGDAIAQVGSTLVFRRFDTNDYGYDPSSLHAAWLEVVDLSNPARPVRAATVELPAAGGHTGLQVNGTSVVTSHWVPLPGDGSRARFYFDHIDVATPASPDVRTPVNVPGSLLAFDSAAGRVLTMDYQRIVLPATTSNDCWNSFGWDVTFEPTDPERYDGPGICTGVRRTLKLLDVGDVGSATATVRDTRTLEDGTYVSSALIGDDRAFLTANNMRWGTDDPYGYSGKVLTVGGIRAGSLEVVTSDTEALSYANPVAASGARLIMSGYNPPSLYVLDATDLDNVTSESKGELASYIYQAVVSGDRAFCSLGYYGLQVVDLGP